MVTPILPEHNPASHYSIALSADLPVPDIFYGRNCIIFPFVSGFFHLA